MAIVKRVTNSAIEKRPEKIVSTLSLDNYYNNRNKILIIRNIGGLGDILMHRMIFEDFKNIMPDAEIHFCCPKYYHDAVKDHPFIDKIFDYKELCKSDYIISYNTTTACGRTEMRHAPLPGPHRSDIWAEHCGVTLSKHNMHINISNSEKIEGNRLLKENCDREGPNVVICPVSAMQNKNLLEHQLVGLVDGLRERGLCALCLHNTPINICYKNNIPLIVESRIRAWMAVLNQADYVVSVDTSAFHCAGGMGKPLVGIFTFTNSTTYGKYYPNLELVQGPCPIGHQGCYAWGNCPCKKDKSNNLVPCCNDISVDSMLLAFDRLKNREKVGVLSPHKDKLAASNTIIL